jgi:hypothetical protein
MTPSHAPFLPSLLLLLLLLLLRLQLLAQLLLPPLLGSVTSSRCCWPLLLLALLLVLFLLLLLPLVLRLFSSFLVVCMPGGTSSLHGDGTRQGRGMVVVGQVGGVGGDTL